MQDNTTDFGFSRVSIGEKKEKVAEVFHSVASKYDLMNDLMSLGVHRHWKKLAVSKCNIRSGDIVLDVAGGTGDLTKKFIKLAGRTGQVHLLDINSSMLKIGRDRLMDEGLLSCNYIQANAEYLPYKDNSFDCISISFGLRNVTDKSRALSSMFRILKPGGRLMVLEFSKPSSKLLEKIYDNYSFSLLPWLGKVVLNDEASYRYLAESIRMHPDQEKLKQMMEDVGFEDCNYHNLTNGIVAIHMGYKY